MENENGENLVPRYINDLKICKENNIPMVVMHLTSKSVAPIYNPIFDTKIIKNGGFLRWIKMFHHFCLCNDM